MERKTMIKNKMNAINTENYQFWNQMIEFKDMGLDFIIPLAIELNNEWLDDYEVI